MLKLPNILNKTCLTKLQYSSETTLGVISIFLKPLVKVEKNSHLLILVRP